MLLALSLAPTHDASAARYAYDGFASAPDLVLQANAQAVDNRMRLTAAKKSQRGGVWLAAKQPVHTSFETKFQFQISDICHYGGNGFSFVIQNNPTPMLGGFGHSAGFWGVSNLVAVQFRTYHYLGGQFVKFDEISILAGDLKIWRHDCSNCLATVTNGIRFSDQSVHTAKINYAYGLLNVFLDNMVTPVMSAEVDLGKLIDLDHGTAWVGFTSATGGDCQNHDLLSWSFTSTDGLSVQIADATQPLQARNVLISGNSIPPATNPTPPQLPEDKAFGHALPSDISLTHEIEASSDLVHWTSVTNAQLYFKDPDSTNYNRRFYRFKVK